MKISLNDLTVSPGKKPLITDLTLTFPAGKITVITGNNGCGKSTLLRTAAGILTPDSGKVLYDDLDISRLSARKLALLRSAVWQNPELPRDMTAGELLALSSYASPKSLSELRSAADMAGYNAGFDRQLTTLSGGEVKRIFLALALAQNTKILFLDEPEANCDAEFRTTLPACLKALKLERSLTIVMVMHDLDLALHCADVIVGMKEGKIEFSSPADAPDFQQKITGFAGKNYSFFTENSGSLRATAVYR